MSKVIPNEIGGGGGPEPQPVPVMNDADSERKRADAERAALLERRNAGRAGTIAYGQALAEEDQMGRGATRSAARALLG